MKVEEELLRRAMSAAFYSQNIVTGPEAERTMRRALAAVAPLIRRAALEEAAGVARNIALQWRGQINTAATHNQRTTFADREAGAMTVLAAIRALDATTKEPTT
jgi:hypothetical protein